MKEWFEEYMDCEMKLEKLPESQQFESQDDKLYLLEVKDDEGSSDL